MKMPHLIWIFLYPEEPLYKFGQSWDNLLPGLLLKGLHPEELTVKDLDAMLMKGRRSLMKWNDIMALLKDSRKIITHSVIRRFKNILLHGSFLINGPNLR